MVTSYVVLQDSLIQKQEQKTKKKKKQENAFVPLDYVISLSLHLYFTFLRKTVGKKIRKFRCSSTLMTTCRKTMNIYYSEVKLLLESFIFLFEPIYKNIYPQSLNFRYSKIEKFFSTRFSSALSFIGHSFLNSSLRFPLLL